MEEKLYMKNVNISFAKFQFMGEVVLSFTLEDDKIYM